MNDHSFWDGHTRHRTTSLFAALDITTGAVIGRCYPKPRSIEFRKFLDRVEKAIPPYHRCPSLDGPPVLSLLQFDAAADDIQIL
jgi:hypothetical protein